MSDLLQGFDPQQRYDPPKGWTSCKGWICCKAWTAARLDPLQSLDPLQRSALTPENLKQSTLAVSQCSVQQIPHWLKYDASVHFDLKLPRLQPLRSLMQEIQEERQCAHGDEPYANGHGNEPYPDAHRPQPDADAHGPTTFPHDPPPNGLWFFLGPNPAPAPPLPPPHRATSESGGASTAFMGSRYIDSDEAAIEGATQDASMMMQREHHPRRQSSDPKRCKDIKKKPKRGRDGSSHTRRA